VALDEHAPEQRCRLRREPVVVRKLLGERIWMRVEVLLEHEQRRNHRDEDVERQERRLQRAVDGPVALPRVDRDA
jgi:hypothetical protein